VDISLIILISIDKKELKLAQVLVEQLSRPFNALEYQDEYRIRLIEVIQKKIQGEEIQIQPSVKANNVMDLLTALKESIEQLKQPASKQKQKKKQKLVDETSTDLSGDKNIISLIAA
jgi:DNA end-binding protein Ku